MTTKQNMFHAIRIRDTHSGLARWYNACGTGSLMRATLFPIRSASQGDIWGQLYGDSDARTIFARLDGIFPRADVHIATVEVKLEWQMRRHIVTTENGRRRMGPEIVEHDGKKWAEVIQVERRIVRDIVE